METEIEATTNNWTKNYQYLTSVWQQDNLCTFNDFLRWYNNNARSYEKMVDFYQNKGIDMLWFGCNLPNLANICLQKSTTAKFYPSTETDKDVLEKIHKDKVGGPSILITSKTVVGEIRTIGAIPLSELMLVGFILSLCVKQCQLVATQDGS